MSTTKREMDDRSPLSALLIAQALVDLDIDVPGQVGEFFRAWGHTLPPPKRELVRRLLEQNANATLRDFANFEDASRGDER